jgi:GntR family transcriptional regulator, rspAB operon transcriptional repressor
MSTPTLALHQPEAADARSLSDQAYYRIRELIVTLELAPGSLVSERELMQLLGVGRTPVREALRALARERLVEVYPRRGMFVSSVEVRDLAGLSEVRDTLEPRAARLAAERANEADRARIDALLEELDTVGAQPSERVLIDLDQRIHRHIYDCTHNPFLATTLNEYYVLTLRIWFLALDRVPRLGDAVREHRALLEAIRDGDGERAEETMRRHVRGFEDAMRRVL